MAWVGGDAGMACGGFQGGQTWVETGEGEGEVLIEVWRGGAAKETKERLEEKFSWAGVTPSPFSPFSTLQWLPLGPPSFLSPFP